LLLLLLFPPDLFPRFVPVLECKFILARIKIG
jgi:hypothetical protein